MSVEVQGKNVKWSWFPKSMNDDQDEFEKLLQLLFVSVFLCFFIIFYSHNCYMEYTSQFQTLQIRRILSASVAY